MLASLLILSSAALLPQQSAPFTIHKATTAKSAGTFSPVSGFVSSKHNRVGNAEVLNNAVLSQYYMLGPGPDQEWVDNNILSDSTGDGEELVDGFEFLYCSTDTNPNGVWTTITIYDESVYCQGPTNWPVADCSYQVYGLPGSSNGATECWKVLVDLAGGSECSLTDGHGGHCGWGSIWDNPNTGPWLASGGKGQTPTYTWFDHTQPPGSAFQGCQSITGSSATGFCMTMYASLEECGMCLFVNGTPGGMMSFDIAGATPGGLIAYMRAFGRGSHQEFNPITGNIVTTGLSSNRFEISYIGATDGTGQYSFATFVPAAAAGLVSVQVCDASTDGQTQVEDL